ncbi:hypothetical protein GQ600_21111 [Phytophthora cactorum]|nr:hypothetical protein GQ600_21111 [Phytophthora cactorum]
MGDINTQKSVNVNSDTDTSTDMDVDDEGKTSETANTPRSRARRKVRRKTRANDATRARNPASSSANTRTSNSSVVDDQGRRVTTTRRRYEDSTDRLKAAHEREIDDKKMRATLSRQSKEDEGQHESICSSGSPEEFEALWQQTPFGEAQKKTVKGQLQSESDLERGVMSTAAVLEDTTMEEAPVGKDVSNLFLVCAGTLSQNFIDAVALEAIDTFAMENKTHLGRQCGCDWMRSLSFLPRSNDRCRDTSSFAVEKTLPIFRIPGGSRALLDTLVLTKSEKESSTSEKNMKTRRLSRTSNQKKTSKKRKPTSSGSLGGYMGVVLELETASVIEHLTTADIASLLRACSSKKSKTNKRLSSLPDVIVPNDSPAGRFCLILELGCASIWEYVSSEDVNSLLQTFAGVFSEDFVDKLNLPVCTEDNVKRVMNRICHGTGSRYFHTFERKRGTALLDNLDYHWDGIDGVHSKKQRLSIDVAPPAQAAVNRFCYILDLGSASVWDYLDAHSAYNTLEACPDVFSRDFIDSVSLKAVENFAVEHQTHLVDTVSAIGCGVWISATIPTTGARGGTFYSGQIVAHSSDARRTKTLFGRTFVDQEVDAAVRVTRAMNDISPGAGSRFFYKFKLSPKPYYVDFLEEHWSGMDGSSCEYCDSLTDSDTRRELKKYADLTTREVERIHANCAKLYRPLKAALERDLGFVRFVRRPRRRSRRELSFIGKYKGLVAGVTEGGILCGLFLVNGFWPHE